MNRLLVRTERRFRLADAAATAAIGARLAECVRSRPGGVAFVHGVLGAGKTTLMRGLLRALGVAGPIRSPTYTLVEPYEPPGCRLLHMDLYRLAEARELHSLGLEDVPPGEAWWWIEWPERGRGALPPALLELHLEIIGAERVATVATDDPEIGAWLGALKFPP